MLEWSGDFNTGTNTQERDYPFFLIGRKSRTPMFPAACCESIDLKPYVIPRSLLRDSSFFSHVGRQVKCDLVAWGGAPVLTP